MRWGRAVRGWVGCGDIDQWSADPIGGGEWGLGGQYWCGQYWCAQVPLVPLVPWSVGLVLLFLKIGIIPEMTPPP